MSTPEHGTVISYIQGQPREQHLLGRFVQHDPRSRAYAVQVRQTAGFPPVSHRRFTGILDQGQLGACTGFAATGALGCAPFSSSIRAARSVFNAAFATQLYSDATQGDEFPGSYPPMDTGSSGLGVAKVLHKRALIAGYEHCFSMEAVLTALQRVPVLIGTVWFSGMDTPDAEGFITPTGNTQGGHEYLLRAYSPDGPDLDNGVLTFDNSWGYGWGDRGRVRMRVRDLRYLLGRQGDAVAMVPLGG